MTVSLLIADDHGIVRGGLRALLDRQADLEVVAEAADGAEALEQALQLRPDLCILDVAMPKLTGLQVARELKGQAPDMQVLMLSMHDDERYLFEALRAGAAGYVLKQAADQDLVDAVRAAGRGEPFLTASAQQTLIRDFLDRGGQPVELTPREQEVLALVAEGLTNAELAERLFISPRTAGVHVSNILAKLGMSSRAEVAAWAVRTGLAADATSR